VKYQPPSSRWIGPALVAGALTALCLLLAGLGGTLRAGALQRGLDVTAGAERVQTLAPLIERWPADRQLSRRLEALIADPRSGMASLVVLDARGTELVSRGRYDRVEAPGRFVRESLRAVLYWLRSHPGEAQLFASDGRPIGLVRFRVGRGSAPQPDPAIAALRANALLALLAGSVLTTGFGLALRSRWRPPERWVHRLPGAADAPGARAAAAAAEARVLEAVRSRIGLALDGLRFGIILVGRDGRVRFLNASAERLTGWQQGDAEGRLVYSVFHVLSDDGVPEVTPAEHCLREGRDILPRERQLRSRQGEVRPVEMMACLVRDGEGVTEGAALLFRDMSTLTRQQDELRRQARLSQGVVDHLEEGLLTTDPAGVVRFANARAQRMFGYSREEMEGVTITKLMPVPFLNTPGVRISDYIGARVHAGLPKVVGWRKDATTFPAELWVQAMNVDGSSGLVIIVRDISERLRGENLASRLGRLLDSAMEEIYIFDAQTLLFLEANQGAQRNLGYRAEQLLGMTPLEISEDLDAAVFQSYLARLRSGDSGHLSYRCRHRRADGSSYPVEVRLNYSREEEPPVFMAIAADIAERQAVEERLHQLAHFDALTGLPNRTVLQDRLDQALLAAGRSSRMVGVFFLDLDHFKPINDQYGHEIGDRVLKAVAERLRTCLRSTDTVARLGGDEFVVVAQGLHSSDDAAQLAQKILDSLGPPLAIDEIDLRVTPSIGVAVYPVLDADTESLLRYADSAMYQAKQAGRACYRLFETDLAPERKRWLELQREVHTAIALNQFRLRLQPVIAADGGLAALMVGFAWHHSRHGVIAADEAGRAAHRAGVRADLELWVVCQACEEMARVGADRAPPMVVEISAWQLRNPEFARYVIDLLDRYRLAAASLMLAVQPRGDGELLSRLAAVDLLQQRGVRLALLLPEPGDPVPGDATTLPYALSIVGLPAGTTTVDLRPLLQRLPHPWLALGIDDPLARDRAAMLGVDYLCGPQVGPELEAGQLDGYLRGRSLQRL
jgi:diguanylate cyclase (GGDEF)-like protein/PAS domain S-box-containing protein